MQSFYLRKTIIASAVASIFFLSTAEAEDLPPDVQTAGAQLGISFSSDGSFTYGGTRYVPLLPPNYDSTQNPSGDPTIAADGSIIWGNLQFAPIVDSPGAVPGFPVDLQVLPGNALPADFQPPAGFVPNADTPLPTGVTVPALSYAALVAEMEAAGMLPAGLVQFNSDGSATVSGTTYLPFLPPEAQQGHGQDPGQRSLTVGANGEVVFPDGSTLVPLVSGQNAGGTTLPTGFTPPANTSLPSDVALPSQFEIPPSMPLPEGIALPAGVVIPENYSLPNNVSLPPGAYIPDSVSLPAGVAVPVGIVLPAGTQLGANSALPAGTTILPNGSMVIPGTEVPSGVVPPSTWIPPSGTTQNADGSMSLPTPPDHGFLPSTMPESVNDDGTIVMPPLASGQTLPAGATLNADGTYTLPAPSFIGSVGSDGTIVALSGGAGMPVGYTPVYGAGTTLPGAGVMPAGTDWMPPIATPGMPTTPPTGGTDATCVAPMVLDASGACVIPPPEWPPTGGTDTTCVAPLVLDASGACVTPPPEWPPTGGTDTTCVAPLALDASGACVVPPPEGTTEPPPGGTPELPPGGTPELPPGGTPELPPGGTPTPLPTP